MGLNRNINDDSTLAYLFNKTRQGASDALQKAIDAINATIASIQTALNNKVSKTGDTMTGALDIAMEGNEAVHLKYPTYGFSNLPSSNAYKYMFFTESGGVNIGSFYSILLTTGEVRMNFRARNRVNNANVDNQLQLCVLPNGTREVVFTDAAPWRSALELGTDGVLPITIAQGGTGATNSTDALTNLNGERRYLINGGSGISTSVKRRLSFSGAVLGLLYVTGSSSARCGLYILSAGTSTVIVEPVKAATACTITIGTGYFDITSTSGTLYATILTAQALSRISETAAT